MEPLTLTGVTAVCQKSGAANLTRTRIPSAVDFIPLSLLAVYFLHKCVYSLFSYFPLLYTREPCSGTVLNCDFTLAIFTVYFTGRNVNGLNVRVAIPQ